MKCLIILSIIAVFSLVNAEKDLRYEIKVHLSNSTFESVKGTLKLYINNEFYRLNETMLKSNETYSSEHLLEPSIEEIDNVKFYWTLAKPIKPGHILKKPSINLFKIMIYPLYVRSPDYYHKNVRHYCPPSSTVGIKHKQEVKLNHCGTGEPYEKPW